MSQKPMPWIPVFNDVRLESLLELNLIHNMQVAPSQTKDPAWSSAIAVRSIKGLHNSEALKESVIKIFYLKAAVHTVKDLGLWQKHFGAWVVRIGVPQPLSDILTMFSSSQQRHYDLCDEAGMSAFPVILELTEMYDSEGLFPEEWTFLCFPLSKKNKVASGKKKAKPKKLAAPPIEHLEEEDSRVDSSTTSLVTPAKGKIPPIRLPLIQPKPTHWGQRGYYPESKF